MSGNSQPSRGKRVRKTPVRGALPAELRAEVHERLRALGMSNKEFAAGAEVHVSEVSRLLRGERGMTVEEAVRFAALLDWHPVRLLPGAPALPVAEPLLPVYRWASCGDPRDRETMDDPDHEEPAPYGQREKVGPNGFGIMVQGDSMTARDVRPLDVVWVNPDEARRINRVVLARAWNEHDEELGLVVKVLGYLPNTGTEGLFSDRLGPGDRPVGLEWYGEGARHEVIGPAVWVTSGRPPGGPRSVSEVRPGHIPRLPSKAVEYR